MTIRRRSNLGGINEDEAYDIAVDLDGNAYVSGRTFSNYFCFSKR